MVAQKKLVWAQLKVGVFVILALTLLSLFILRAGWGGRLFTLAPKQFYAKTYLPSVERLKPGSPVWLSGLEVGYVTNVKFVPYAVYTKNHEILDQIHDLKRQIELLEQTRPPDYIKKRADLYDDIRERKTGLRTVEIDMKIDNQYRDRIRTDSEVSIGSSGLIGESYIDISVGSFRETPKMIWDADIKQEVLVIEGLATAGLKEILTGANDVVANFRVFADQVKRMTNKVDVERIGLTITNVGENMDRTFKEGEVALSRFNKLILDVQEGRGTIGQFMVNSSVYDEIESTSQNITDMTDQIKSGKGTIGRLLHDEALYDVANNILKQVDSFTERIEKGEGNLGLLAKDRALYDRTNHAVEQLTTLAEGLNRGEGTLGKVLKDETLHGALNQTLSEVTKLIYDFRQNPKRFLTINFKVF